MYNPKDAQWCACQVEVGAQSKNCCAWMGKVDDLVGQHDHPAQNGVRHMPSTVIFAWIQQQGNRGDTDPLAHFPRPLQQPQPVLMRQLFQQVLIISMRGEGFAQRAQAGCVT